MPYEWPRCRCHGWEYPDALDYIDWDHFRDAHRRASQQVEGTVRDE